MNLVRRWASRWRDLKLIWARRAVYRSWADVFKASFLRRHTAAPAHAEPRPREISIHLKGVPAPVYCRVDSSDFLVLSEIFEGGEYAPVAGWGLPEEPTIIDLGGNVGLATLYFSTLRPRMRGVVVEPDAANCDLIRRNCRALVEEGRLRVVQAFVAAHDGSAGIDRSGRSWAFKKSDDVPAPGEAIPCLAMPTLLQNLPWGDVDLLKCDIEGSEQELFAACAPWIHRVRHLIVETHPPYGSTALYEDLRRAGWSFDLINERDDGAASICAMRRK